MSTSNDHGPFLILAGPGIIRYVLTGAGLFFAFAMATGTIESGSGPNKTTAPQYVSFVIGGVIALITIAIFRVTGPVILDLGNRSVSLPRKSPLDVNRRRASLDDFTAVCLKCRIEHVRTRTRAGSTSNRTKTVYALQLAGATGGALELRTYVDYLDARRRAEEVAEFLHLPLTDSGDDKTTTRGPAELNETYVNRIRRKAVRQPLAESSRRGRIEASQDGDAVLFLLPRKPTTDWPQSLIVEIIVLSIGLAAIWMVGTTFFPAITAYVFAGAVAAIVLVNIAYSNEQTLIRASTSGLRVTRRRRWISDVSDFDADHLEELETIAEGLLARSDRATVKFGETLSQSERNWLHSAITHALLGEPQPTQAPAARSPNRKRRSRPD